MEENRDKSNKILRNTSQIYEEDTLWKQKLGIETVGKFNELCRHGRMTDLILVSEAMQERRIVAIADQVEWRIGHGMPTNFILIAGPSSSGKTTFSKRLRIQLMTLGLEPVVLSLDDYFVNRVDTPLDDDGNYDFESLYAIDIPLFEHQLNSLLKGESVQTPTYNFTTGTREYENEPIRLTPQTVLIIEGIHALNPELTAHISDGHKFRIYVSALTRIFFDETHYMPRRDNRLLRRIVRDYKYRNFSAQQTIERWPSVRAGEVKWILPFENKADAMFNSSLYFEVAVLKDYLMPILQAVPTDCKAHAEALRLMSYLEQFISLTDDDIPPTSLLREFVGGSSFHY